MTPIHGHINEVFPKLIDYLLRGDPGHVLLGPVVLDEHDKPYFVIGSATEREFQVDQLTVDTLVNTREWRTTAIAALIERGPIVIHDFDDELELARMAHAICPCAKTKRILDAIRADRAASA
jgi:hypothetical protein